MANGNFGGGNGTSGSPYKIEDSLDFKNISLNPSAYFILVNDITINTPLTPIPTFSGEIDGQNHIVTNFKNPSTSWINTLLNGVLKNVIFHNPTFEIYSTNIPHSLLFGSINNSQVYSVNITGEITYIKPFTGSDNSLYTGSIINDNSRIQNCHIYSNHTFDAQSGGFALFSGLSSTLSSNSYPITNCSNYLSVTTDANAQISMTSTNISDSKNYGNFTNTRTTSGANTLCFPITSANALRCSNYGNISSFSPTTATTYYNRPIGGTATDCVNYGNVSSTRSVGISTTAVRCVNYGDVTSVSTANTGRAHGIAVGSNSNCFFAGNIYIQNSSIPAYYGNSDPSSNQNVNLKVLDTSTINVGG